MRLAFTESLQPAARGEEEIRPTMLDVFLLDECDYMHVSSKKLLPLVLAALSLTSCAKQDSPSTTEPTILRIAVLPGQSSERSRQRYAPLIEYLSQELKIPCQLVLTDSYEEILHLFENEQVEVAKFGGLTFAKASRSSQAVPLVMRDIDMRFTSYFLVRADSSIRTLKDCRGLKLTFGSKLSTSGHLMPRYFMQTKNIQPEDYFSKVLYSGAHDRTAYHVRDGLADLGVANRFIIEQLLEEGKLSHKDVRVLWETPPYADYVWAARKGVPEKTQRQIRDAFLALSIGNPQHQKILSRVNAESYLPASQEDFSHLFTLANELGLLQASP